MRIALREEAVADLEGIHAFIAKDSPRNADKVRSRIWLAITHLIAAFPDIGRVGQVEDTRELPVRGLPYVVVYQFDEARGVVNIVNVLHGARSR
jgi:plasmid stabilization system protein ParE